METAVIVALIMGLPGLVAAYLVFKRSGQANNTNDKAQELAWTKEMRQDAIDTRKEMETLQDQVRTLRRQLDTVTREAEHWISEYQFANRTIHREGITLSRLREMFPPIDPADPPGRLNGTRV